MKCVLFVLHTNKNFNVEKNSPHVYVNFTGNALVDLMTKPTEDAPKVGTRVLCRHPFQVGVLMWLKQKSRIT